MIPPTHNPNLQGPMNISLVILFVLVTLIDIWNNRSLRKDNALLSERLNVQRDTMEDISTRQNLQASGYNRLAVAISAVSTANKSAIADIVSTMRDADPHYKIDNLYESLQSLAGDINNVEKRLGALATQQGNQRTIDNNQVIEAFADSRKRSDAMGQKLSSLTDRVDRLMVVSQKRGARRA